MTIKSGALFLAALVFLTPGEAPFKPSLAAQSDGLPKSRAEQSGYTDTSRYEDVVDFINEIAKKSELARVTSFGKSVEGRDLPLVVLSNPPIGQPNEARASGKLIIFVMANIHAGEVEGKEATLHLIREMTFGSLKPLLDRLVVLVAPIYNADGNERISAQNRRNQNGPPGGVGVRENAKGLDLNRDYMKLDSPEANGLIQHVFNMWDPHFVVDCHTTNGSYHGYQLTYDPPLNPNGHPGPISYVQDRMLPNLTETLDKKYGFKIYFYGNFIDRNDPSKGWQTFDHRPRFGNNYLGLRNRMTILSEAYAYADYKTRIAVTERFVQSILEYSATQAAEMMEIIKRADKETTSRGLAPKASDQLGLRFKVKPFDKLVDILGYEMVEETDPATGQKRYRRTETPRIYRTQNFGLFEATRSFVIPRGYVVPLTQQEVVKKLLAHGIVVERLRDALTVEAEVYHVESMNSANQPFQGHRETSLQGKFGARKVELPAGSFYVPMAQPKANLVFYLLEPESDDGLANWNFFDSYLQGLRDKNEAMVYPVYRLHQSLNAVRWVVRPSEF